MRYSVLIDGVRHSLALSQDEAGQWQVSLDDTPLAIDRAQISPGRFSLLIGTRSYDVFVRSLPANSEQANSQYFEVMLDGRPYPIELMDERRQALTGAARGGHHGGEVAIKAPMPGLVVNVLVAPGDVVEHHQRVVVLEAMKMQNDLTAPRAGIVRAVKTAPGQAVNQGQTLVVIGDPDEKA